MKEFVTEALLPLVATLAATIIPLLAAFIAERFRQWTGLEMEARHREALQSALANAARMIVAGATKQAGVEYVLSSVPDALRAFKIDDDLRIEGLLEPHIKSGLGKK